MERLTEDVVLRIFASLELHDLASLRCVCRSWNSAITSQQFAKLWKGRDQVCCVLRTRQKDGFRTEVWYPGSGARRPTGLNPGPREFFSIGVSFSHGLVCALEGEVCYWSTPDTAWNFVVGNPLTNKWRRLPPIDIPSRPFNVMERMHLEVDPSKGSYKLAIAYSEVGSDNEVIYHKHQYDSESRGWKSAVPFIGEDDSANTKIDGSVLGSMGLAFEPYFVMAYNRFVADPAPDNGWIYREYNRELTFLCGVFRWRGSIFMVTHSSSCVMVSELDFLAGKRKVLSSRRYEELCGKKPSGERENIQVLLVGSTIVFSEGYSNAPYAYNLEDSTWGSSTCHASADTGTALSCAFIPSFNIEP